MRIDPAQDRAMGLRAQARGSRGGWMRLLSEVLHLAGPGAELVRHGEKPWASVTFSGTRHTVCLRFAGPAAFEAADDFIESLPEHEFTLAGQVVIDAEVTSVDQVALPTPLVTVEASLLLLEDN